jgi:predicted RNA-binding protein with PUA-like domain
MKYWLMKSEPSEVSIDHLADRPGQTVDWFGVRNYAARNFLRSMKKGDQAFFYHSSCPEPGIAGLVEIVGEAYPDPTQFDPKDPHFDPKSPRDNPRWSTVDVKLVRKVRLVSLATLRGEPALAGLTILQKGNRLSVTPVDPEHAQRILQMAEA